VPSVFSHAVVGSTLVACGLREPRARLVAIGAALAMLPDLDVFGLAIGWGLDHPLGHRGLSHSLTAAAALATVAVLVARGREADPRRAGTTWWVWLVLFVATASHGVLDALTNGGRGVAFLAPFSARRWHFGVQPIEVSPIGVREFFVGGRGLDVIANELLWLWLPSLVLLAMVWGVRRVSGPRTPAAHVPDR
jgi:inner membrane protein